MAWLTLEQEIYHKAGLSVDGANIEPAACEGVGDIYMEKVWWLFVYDVQKQSGLKNVPDYIVFPKGTIADFRWNSQSSYWIRKNDGIIYLEKNGKFICPIEFVERPAYYSKNTSSGKPMKTIGTIRGKHGLMVCTPLFCANWVGDSGPCKYCNMNPGMDEYDNKAVTKKQADEVGEVAAALLSEGVDFHFVCSAGQPPAGKSTVPGHIELMEAIKKYTGLEKIPGTANLSPPDNLDELEPLWASGIQSLFLNLEVWNRDLYNYLCPGKTKRYGQQHYIDALVRGAELWGRGYSWSGMVAGLEDKKSILEGVKIMAEKGVPMLMQPWVPMVASELEGHRSPEAAWHLDLQHKVLEIYEDCLPEVGSEKGYWEQFGCPSCLTISLHFDVLRLRHNIDTDGLPAPHGPKGQYRNEKKGCFPAKPKELNRFLNGKSEVLTL
ncbi:MAG: radical SAM protein [Sterolibacterium sp.]